ncbi:MULTISPECIES: DUF4344 domain-containing metallopeptidase [Deefgea]|uniref:Metallopeptidase n=1 Tax=Deefgea chitinilytica TaxID=570276 RepID=A0ABS2CA57_9NEIS|nr:MULTISPECIES: DUF4344 domain-containing metallopeptidase [Deefgea]MBM5570261.1 hypothetical protein [Deefgea chitinilytica]MBM9887490.1 hypothetical protein [Deefgea sp. CFH1-16]
MQKIIRLLSILMLSAAFNTTFAAPQVIVTYTPPVDENLKPYYEFLKSRQALEAAAGTAKLLQWPTPLTLEAKQCNEVNAMYVPGEARVIMCYEIFKDLVEKVEAQLGHHDQKYRDDIKKHAAVFLFRHELSHAIFDILKIPLIGNEEIAADAVAFHYSLEQKDMAEVKKLLQGAKFYFMRRNENFGDDTRYDFGAFSDIHPLSEQRYFNMLCYTYAKFPEEAEFLVKQELLPQGRADYCPREWKQLQDGVHRLIRPYAVKAKK